MESIHTDKPTYYVCAQRLTQFEKISHQFTGSDAQWNENSR